ncbi:protein kinase domain-containing protein [Capilliphycus salinus ALCB114379]|uniref:protein kinase domain-containing protein n=1 Tax=Capilliphycus salinus TaxID=2768948 RepID=UPI0039A4BEA2
MIGQLVDGRYQILKVIESTELGKTYLAKDTRRPGESLCFVKHLHLVAEDPEFVNIARRRFQQEAQTLEKLSQHDRIPQLLAYFEESKEFYLVESYVSGQSLAHEIIPGHPLPEDSVIKILIEVLEILLFVHGHGVIHRDLKPTNLIRRNSDGKIVLIDFGAVKEINMNQHHNPPTARIGTIEYMPVEQFDGNPHFNSDIYALGMIGIQALTGIPIFELRKLRENNQSNTNELAWRHLAIVSQELGDILDKMVRYDYQKRYQSAGETLAALRRLDEDSQTLLARQNLYREEVKQRSNHRGDISIVGRKILDELRLSLELSKDEAESIEDEILNPYRKYREKGERYEQALIESMQQEYPFTPETRLELQRLQQVLGLSDEDVAFIEKQILPLSLREQILSLFSRVKSPKTTAKPSRNRRRNRQGISRNLSSLWILIGAIIAAIIAIIFAIIEYQRWQQTKEMQAQQRVLDRQQLTRVENILDRGNYELCVNEAAKIPESSTQYTAVQKILQQCNDALNWRQVKVRDFAQHLGSVSALAFRPDGRTIVSGSRDQTVKVWDVRTGALLQNFAGDLSPITSVDFSPNGDAIAAGSFYWRVLEWSLETGELFVPLEHLGTVWSVAFSPDERTIASGSGDRSVRVWDRQTGYILYDFIDHTDIVYSVAFNTGGTKLVSGSKDSTINIMDLQTGIVENTLRGHTDEVRSVAFTPDSTKVVSGGYDDTVRIWDVNTGRLLNTLTGHTGDILSVAVSPDGQLVASASKDRTIKIWNIETGELLNTLSGHTNEVYTVTFSPDGKTIASGSKDRTIKLWIK